MKISEYENFYKYTQLPHRIFVDIIFISHSEKVIDLIVIKDIYDIIPLPHDYVLLKTLDHTYKIPLTKFEEVCVFEHR